MDRENKKFRFYAQRVLLTYKTKVDKENYRKWAIEDLGAEEIHIAHETGETGYEHSHVLLEWDKAFQTKSQWRFDFLQDGHLIHPNIKPIKTREHLKNCYLYLAKEDTECVYLLTKTTSAFSKRIWSAATLTEALEKVERPSDVLGTLVMWKNKPREEIKKEEIPRLRPWQQIVIDIIEGEPDDRTILWIFDGEGGAGKSRLCRYLEDRNQAIVLTGLSCPRDIAQNMRGRIEKGENTRCIIADLSRSYQDRDIYNTLEMLKNGRMDSPKYESTSLRWNPGHVIVMANFPPDKLKMTCDRWRIMTIE